MWVFRLGGTLDSREADLDALWSAGATGLEERGGEVRAYFPEKVNVTLPGTWQEEADQDWQAEWKKDLKPVQAGKFSIVPPWLKDEVPSGQIPLLIEVGMAFGTGHHETTKMAVEALQDFDLGGKHVLDVGTGSGVLAIAAALLGAELAVGVDIDPVTIPAAQENARLNGFEARQGEFVHADGGKLLFFEGTLENAAGAPYALIVANLYAELHDTLMADYRTVLIPGGHLILTGILTEKLPVVLSALTREGFAHQNTRTEGEWALVTARA